MLKHDLAPDPMLRETVRNLSSWVAALAVELPTSTHTLPADNQSGEQVWQSIHLGDNDLTDRLMLTIANDEPGQQQRVYVTHESEQVDHRYPSPQDALWPERESTHSTVSRKTIDLCVPAEGMARVISSKVKGLQVVGIAADKTGGRELYRSFTIHEGHTHEGEQTTSAAQFELDNIVRITARHLGLVKGYGTAALALLLPRPDFNPLAPRNLKI